MTVPILGHADLERLDACVDGPVKDGSAAESHTPERSDKPRPGTRQAVDPGPTVPLALKLCVVGLLVTGAWAAALWMSTHVQTDAPLRSVALFAHLSALIVGLGAVLTIDWCALLWILGRRSLLDVLTLASGSHPIVWFGLAVLTASGALLSPDLDAPRAQLKMVLVLVIALNGVQAYDIQSQLERHAEPPPGALLIRSVFSAGLSQACWWGAASIGFLTQRAQ